MGVNGDKVSAVSLEPQTPMFTPNSVFVNTGNDSSKNSGLKFTF